MTMLDQAEDLVSRLTRGEKGKLLQSIVRDLGNAFPGMVSRPGICGGEPCIVRTRIPVWILERARQLGTTEAQLLGSYPTIRARAGKLIRVNRFDSSK
jgi:uncharacterized protein (DUF433 family)